MSAAFIAKPVWSGKAWTCDAPMPAWHAQRKPPRGDIVACTFLTDESEPNAALLATLCCVVEEQALLHETVTVAMRSHYDSVWRKYSNFARAYPHFMGDPGVSMPESPDAATFGALHVLQGLFIHPVLKNGLAYVGFSFHARWEPEHGVGVMVHHRRVVEVGGADVAFLTWIAEKDVEDGSEGLGSSAAKVPG